MLDKSWLPDVRRDLMSDENSCLYHINSNTFEEQPFVDYFLHWEQYIQILMNFPDAKDLYDARNLGKIAAYYNAHTQTNNNYNEGTGKKETVQRVSSSHTSNRKSENTKNYVLIGASIILLILLLRGCAHGEAQEIKKALTNAKRKQIEFLDQNYVSNPMDEFISEDTYPVRSLRAH